MGDPYFQAKAELEANQVFIYSICYPLYADVSRRVMCCLGQAVPDMEVYSIDEAFLDLHGMERYLVESLDVFARNLREKVRRRTGIPTCVGIAPTKTLAKLANRIAKKQPALGGVLHLDTDERQQWALEQVGVGDVWGVGQQYAAKLSAASRQQTWPAARTPGRGSIWAAL